MKKLLTLVMVLSVLLIAVPVSADSPPTTFYYGDVTLDNWGAGNFSNVWDVTACDLTLSYTIDMSGITIAGWAVTEVGVRQVGAGNLDPNLVGGWMQSNYIYTANDPNTQDNNDMHFLSKHGWLYQKYDATDPDTLITPYWSGANYGFWFDRDGVDPTQANLWGNINGSTYNTDGIYDMVVRYHAIDTNKGTMFATINGVHQGLYIGGWKNAQPEFYPAGRSFIGDMTQMQVFYGRGGGGGTVTLSDITVTGCLVLQEGMATGGGWFIPEDDNAVGLTNLGGKATFGFVAKQDDKKGSSGHLEFQYHADNLNLKSTSYDWVNVSSTQAMFEGVGTINDMGSYRFRVRAVDGDKLGNGTDRFEIRIWTGNGDTWDMPTYRAEGDLGGGQIVVHKK